MTQIVPLTPSNVHGMQEFEAILVYVGSSRLATPRQCLKTRRRGPGEMAQQPRALLLQRTWDWLTALTQGSSPECVIPISGGPPLYSALLRHCTYMASR